MIYNVSYWILKFFRQFFVFGKVLRFHCNIVNFVYFLSFFFSKMTQTHVQIQTNDYIPVADESITSDRLLEIECD